MILKLKSCLDKTKLACLGTAYVTTKWKYALLSFSISMVFAFILTLTISGNTDWRLLTSSITVIDKLELIGAICIRVFANATTLHGFLVLLLAILQGMSIALLTFSYKMHKRVDGDSLSSTGIASIIAFLGLGCSTCGTSLLMPLINILFTSSAYIIADSISSVMMIVAFVLSFYTIRRLGFTIYIAESSLRHQIRKGKNEKR
jgi:hypothetical protein